VVFSEEEVARSLFAEVQQLIPFKNLDFITQLLIENDAPRAFYFQFLTLMLMMGIPASFLYWGIFSVETIGLFLIVFFFSSILWLPGLFVLWYRYKLRSPVEIWKKILKRVEKCPNKENPFSQNGLSGRNLYGDIT
jgi:hypothetical protein